MKALILAAGYGTRLYPLTKKYPKPLLPVAKKPILGYIIEKLCKVKTIHEIIVVTNDKFYAAFLKWAGKSGASCGRGQRITVLNDGTKTEQDRLGAIGDIRFALERARIEEDTVIFGGDNLFEESVAPFLRFSSQKHPQVTIGAYDIKRKSLAGRYGVVTADSRGRIVDFAEKPAKPQSTLIATCLYYIPAEKLSRFKEYLEDTRNEKDTSGSFIRWLSKKEAVYGFVFKKHWYDIGDPQAYEEADRVFAKLTKEKNDGKT